jgi:hypothetical protein
MKFDPPLSLIRSQEPPLRLENSEELDATLTNERKFLSDLGKAAQGDQSTDGSLDETVRQAIAVIDRYRGQLHQLSSQQTASTPQYIDLLRRYQAECPGITPDGVAATFLRLLSHESPAEAARAAACFYEVPFNPGGHGRAMAWLRAGALAEMLRRSWTGGESLERMNVAWENFSSKWEQRFGERAGSLDLQLGQMKASTEAISGAVASQDARSAELVHRYTERFDTAVDEGKAEIKAIAETYKTELALQAPTTYWAEKQRNHWFVSVGWAIAFAGGIGTTYWAIWEVWYQTIHAALIQVKGTAPLALPYAYYLPTLAVFFLCVWVLRIFSRQLLSNLSLSSDAGERVAMVKTFLSLMQMPEHVKEPDRVIILSALFRSTSTQPEDATPPNWFDMIMQRLGPKAD